MVSDRLYALKLANLCKYSVANILFIILDLYCSYIQQHTVNSWKSLDSIDFDLCKTNFLEVCCECVITYTYILS